MEYSSFEKLFQLFDESAIVLESEIGMTYLEALAETGENIFQAAILQEELSDVATKRLEKIYSSVQLDSFTNEEIRKAFQLAILKGMKKFTQPNHQMTPETIGLLFSYLVNKSTEGARPISILDLTCGTGNLLTAVLNQLPAGSFTATAIDIDDVLVRLAYTSCNLQRHDVQFYTQDSLQKLLIDPVDVVVADLPVGYYPDTVTAAEFALKSEEGMSYSHHLLIEQAMNYAKEGAHLFFLVPNHLFTSPEAPKLNEYLKEHAHIQGLMQLPLSMFKSEQHAKSILYIRKQGENVEQPTRALLVELPTLTNQTALQKVIGQMNEWFAEQKK